jgi:hypothetical protein
MEEQGGSFHIIIALLPKRDLFVIRRVAKAEALLSKLVFMNKNEPNRNPHQQTLDMEHAPTRSH